MRVLYDKSMGSCRHGTTWNVKVASTIATATTEPHWSWGRHKYIRASSCPFLLDAPGSHAICLYIRKRTYPLFMDWRMPHLLTHEVVHPRTRMRHWRPGFPQRGRQSCSSHPSIQILKSLITWYFSWWGTSVVVTSPLHLHVSICK